MTRGMCASGQGEVVAPHQELVRAHLVLHIVQSSLGDTDYVPVPRLASVNSDAYQVRNLLSIVMTPCGTVSKCMCLYKWLHPW